ncbi:hypothetical protein ACVILK_007312 [Bradyrhizobium embrapense]
MKTVRTSFQFALAAWLVILLLGVLPYAGSQALKIKDRPRVMGFFSNYREVSGTKGSRYVVATLDFDRPSPQGLVHCKIDPYTLGPVNTEASKLSNAQFAVQMGTCEAAIQLPLGSPHDLWGWIRLLLLGSMYATIIGCVYSFAMLHDYVWKRGHGKQTAG